MERVGADAHLRPWAVGVQLVRDRLERVGVLVDDRHLTDRRQTFVDQVGKRVGVGGEVAVDEARDLVDRGGAEHRTVGRPRVHGAHADGIQLLALVGEPLGVHDES